MAWGMRSEQGWEWGGSHGSVGQVEFVSWYLKGKPLEKYACVGLVPQGDFSRGMLTLFPILFRQSELIGCMSFGVKSLLTPDKVQ